MGKDDDISRRLYLLNKQVGVIIAEVHEGNIRETVTLLNKLGDDIVAISKDVEVLRNSLNSIAAQLKK